MNERRVMPKPLRDTYRDFKQQHSDVPASFTTFVRNKPINVITPVNSHGLVASVKVVPMLIFTFIVTRSQQTSLAPKVLAAH